MSISPVGGAPVQPATAQPIATGLTGAGQQIGAQPVSSTDTAAQDWEAALLAAIGDDPSTASASTTDPAQAALAGASPATSSGAPTTAAAGTSTSTGLLLALLGGSPSANSNPLVTSLSAGQGSGTDPVSTPGTGGLA
ncbi:MAG TPA: hypothetical protein VG371_00925 [Solirubrobacteraceae bacterium]|jgi:hypothetical protein|nr:hypothetical protein [Solirubrobacteraceae bacterium]